MIWLSLFCTGFAFAEDTLQLRDLLHNRKMVYVMKQAHWDQPQPDGFSEMFLDYPYFTGSEIQVNLKKINQLIKYHCVDRLQSDSFKRELTEAAQRAIQTRTNSPAAGRFGYGYDVTAITNPEPELSNCSCSIEFCYDKLLVLTLLYGYKVDLSGSSEYIEPVYSKTLLIGLDDLKILPLRQLFNKALQAQLDTLLTRKVSDIAERNKTFLQNKYKSKMPVDEEGNPIIYNENNDEYDEGEGAEITALPPIFDLNKCLLSLNGFYMQINIPDGEPYTQKTLGEAITISLPLKESIPYINQSGYLHGLAELSTRQKTSLRNINLHKDAYEHTKQMGVMAETPYRLAPRADISSISIYPLNERDTLHLQKQTSYHFDHSGLLKQTKTYADSGIFSLTNYQHDRLGRLVSIRSFEKGILVEADSFIYDGNGNLVDEQGFSESYEYAQRYHFVYGYSGNSVYKINITELPGSGERTPTVYLFDSAGNKLREGSVNSAQDPFHIYSKNLQLATLNNSIPPAFTLNCYNNAGQLLISEYELSYHYYTYNQNAQLSSSVYCDRGAFKDELKLYYDARGLEVKEVRYNGERYQQYAKGPGVIYLIRYNEE